MKYVLYNHVGSANHGCEALVRTIASTFGEKNTILLSEAPEEEEQYGISDLIEVYPALVPNRNVFDFIKAFLCLKLKKDYFPLDILPYKKAVKSLKQRADVLVSIGGDIYCYNNYPKYILLHRYAMRFVQKSILLGCSIEPSSLSDEALLCDLQSYDLISARESITYNALLSAGLKNVIYCPDTAFGLLPEQVTLPENFIPGETVGLNISPLVLQKSQNGSLLLDNYCRVIEYILEQTSHAVGLIPHVRWKNNDDTVPLSELYKKYKYSGRVCLLPDLSAPKAKYCISKCRYFIGARTHATIAAYSTGVPTLVLGYSVKSKGIARDLFGTEEKYVIDYQCITDDMSITNGFQWLQQHEERIRSVLHVKNKDILAQLAQMKKDIVGRLEGKNL